VNVAAPESGVHARAPGTLNRINAEVLARRRIGQSWAVIGDAVGIGEGAAIARGKWLREQGYDLPRATDAHTPWQAKARLRAKLIALWNERPTVSTAEIGRRLGVTKNAVIGTAHRLKLPARPNPVRRSGEAKSDHPRPGRPPRVPASVATVPALASLKPPQAAAAPHRVPVQHVREPPLPARYGRVVECCWPLDHPTNPRRFLACDAPTEPGKPYCPVHCDAAYQPRRLVPA
jgi:GcrA cell cycle regulator